MTYPRELLVVSLAHPLTHAVVAIGTGYEASTVTGEQTISLKFDDPVDRTAISDIQLWYRAGKGSQQGWRCGFEQAHYDGQNGETSGAQHPKLVSLDSASHIVSVAQANTARTLLADDTWKYPFSFGVDIKPERISNNVAVDFFCTRKLPSGLGKDSSPTISAPYSDVVILGQHEGKQSISYDVNYPASWSLASISRDRDLGAGSTIGPSLIVNPGELSKKLAPTGVSDGGALSLVMPSPEVRFTNPQAQRSDDQIAQFVLLLLGAWLGIVGGILGERFLKSRKSA